LFQNQSKELPALLASKDDEGRERRHTGGGAGGVTPPNQVSGGENKSKLVRQNSQQNKTGKLNKELNTQGTSTTQGTGCTAKIDLYLTALKQARQFIGIKSPLSKKICSHFIQFLVSVRAGQKTKFRLPNINQYPTH
jgi:hypothetical protein